MPTVLVVEDEAAIAELIAINLRHAGFEVTLAENADQATVAVDAVLPDLVLLDWMLPGQSGVALARRRADQGTAYHHADRACRRDRQGCRPGRWRR